MSINLMPFAVVGVILLLTVAALFVWRRMVASHEDDTIHVLEDATAIPNQVAVGQKLEVIDKWGKMATLVAVVYIVALAALYVWQEWVGQSTGVR